MSGAAWVRLSQPTLQAINGWVSATTQGRITQAVTDDMLRDPSIACVLGERRCRCACQALPSAALPNTKRLWPGPALDAHARDAWVAVPDAYGPPDRPQ